MWPGKPWTPKICQECLSSSNQSPSRISRTKTANRTSLYVSLDEIKIICCKVINNISLARRIVFPGFVWSFLYFIGTTCFFIIILRVLVHRQFPEPVVLDWCLFWIIRRLPISSLFVTLRQVQVCQLLLNKRILAGKLEFF